LQCSPANCNFKLIPSFRFNYFLLYLLTERARERDREIERTAAHRKDEKFSHFTSEIQEAFDVIAERNCSTREKIKNICFELHKQA
jgi:hypothetical protein